MKKILLSIALLATALCSQAQNHHGQTNKDIMDVAVKVNAYFMKKNPDPTLPTFVKRMRPSSLWTRAVYYEGLMALYESDMRRSNKYLFVIGFCCFLGWRGKVGIVSADTIVITVSVVNTGNSVKTDDTDLLIFPLTLSQVAVLQASCRRKLL